VTTLLWLLLSNISTIGHVGSAIGITLLATNYPGFRRVKGMAKVNSGIGNISIEYGYILSASSLQVAANID